MALGLVSSTGQATLRLGLSALVFFLVRPYVCACMHGGAFPKATKLKVSPKFLMFWVLDVTIHTPMRAGECERNMAHGSLTLPMKPFIPNFCPTYG